MIELVNLRQEIDAIDARIVALIGERFVCTDKVGHLKSAHQLPAVDTVREAQQMTRFEGLAHEHGINPTLLRQIFRSIVDKHKKLSAPAAD